MGNILLAVFLALSLATQVPGFGAQVSNEHALNGVSQSAGPGRTYSMDFDDEQRGSKAFALGFVNHLIPRGTVEDSFEFNDRQIHLCFASLPLFKLYAALLI